jgi:hypothetical protein
VPLIVCGFLRHKLLACVVEYRSRDTRHLFFADRGAITRPCARVGPTGCPGE